MKRFLRFFLGAAAAACLCVSALAAASADLVRTFVYDGTLYTYVVLSGVTEPITKAEATVGGQVFPASDSLKTVRQAGSPVVEMLLVDCSNSMPDFASDVTAFAQTLAQASGENTRFLLATFGKEFTVLSEDLSGAELTDAAGSIAYTATQTRLNTSLDQALDYFAALPRSGNELRSIIVLSDAVQYDPQGGVSQESLAARLEESDVLLHAVGFGSDTEALAPALRVGRRLPRDPPGGRPRPDRRRGGRTAGILYRGPAGHRIPAGRRFLGRRNPAGDRHLRLRFAAGMPGNVRGGAPRL